MRAKRLRWVDLAAPAIAMLSSTIFALIIVLAGNGYVLYKRD